MPPKISIPEIKGVKKRFFDSYEELRYRKLVKTQKEFCDAVGISSASNFIRIGNEESGSEPSIASIILLKKAYNVSLDWLLLGQGDFISE
jgi:transcriptional regulator with XRE-family HTH domain